MTGGESGGTKSSTKHWVSREQGVRGKRALGWSGALKDFPEKQGPGMRLLRGKKTMELSDFLKKQKGGKVKNLYQREWHSYPPLWPLGTEQPVLPPPPTKETREVKEK